MQVFDLWIPIVASGFASHVLSTIAWTAIHHHDREWNKAPNEDRLMDEIAKGIPPGQYIFPHTCDGKEAATQEFKDKQKKCSGILIVWPNPIQMGKAIGLTFTYFMVVAFVIGYLASLALPPGSSFLKVFQFATTCAMLPFCFGQFPFVFWFRRTVLLEVIDGLVFAIATGLIFASLWPAS